MKILYFHQYFSTPKGANGTRSYEMALELTRRGHEVCIVCCGDERSEVGLDKAFRLGSREGEIAKGFRVIQLKIPYANKFSLAKRAMVFMAFAAFSTFLALTRKFDMAFSTSPPLTISAPCFFAKIFRRKKFVFEVRDPWPESPKALGLKNPVILGIMSALEWMSHRLADGCIGLSPGIVDGIKRKSPVGKKVIMIPNGSDIGLFDQGDITPKRPDGISQDDFVAIFTGAHGEANGLGKVLDAAAELKRRRNSRIKILFIGGGKQKNLLVRRAEEEMLDNCVFMDFVPKTELTNYLKGADAGLQVLKDCKAFYYGTSPNKFFDYLAVGLPVINNYPGWVADLISENNCGLAIPPDDPNAFADALENMAGHPDKTKIMAKNARILAEKEFSRTDQAAAFADFLEQVNKS